MRRRWGPPGHRPPWWPEDEAWPPRGGPPWAATRGRFFRRMAFFAVALVVLTVAAATIAFLTVASAVGAAESGATGRGALLLVVFVVALALVGRAIRGMAAPLGDVIEAAGRVEAGESGVRVAERGPREVRALSRAFNTMVSRLEASEALRRRLLADVSHELRTPLAVVQGNLEALLDGVYAADEAHIRPIFEETRVLGRLIEDLRTLSLAEAGALALHREPTDVGAIVRETAASFAPQARAAGISVETKADAGHVADVDPVRSREVLANLVANAVRYARTRVVLEVASNADRLAVTVTDDGPGIAPDILPHVFERFSKSAESRGAGLGLAIAKSLVTAHGGEIGAESVDGQGTRVRFTLPIAG